MLSQIFIIFIHLCAIGFLVHRIYRATNVVGKQISAKILVTYLLLMVVNCNIYQGKMQYVIPWWMYISGHVSMHLATVIGYFIVDQFLNSRTYTIGQMVRHRVFLISMVLSGAMIVVDALRKDLSLSIWNTYAFERSWMYMTSYVLFSSVLLYSGVLIVKLFQDGLRKYQEPGFLLRTGLSMTGYIVGVLVSIIAITNVVLAFLVDHPYRVLTLQVIEDVGMPIVFVLTVVGSVLPNRFYAWASSPIAWYRDRRQRHEQQLLEYVHACMIQIVPRVHLENQALRHLRTQIEIADAREIMWSHIPHTQPLTPREEAKHLAVFLQTLQVFVQPGKHEPHVIQSHPRKHNLAVARHLKRLEQRRMRWVPNILRTPF